MDWMFLVTIIVRSCWRCSLTTDIVAASLAKRARWSRRSARIPTRRLPSRSTLSFHRCLFVNRLQQDCFEFKCLLYLYTCVEQVRDCYLCVYVQCSRDGCHLPGPSDHDPWTNRQHGSSRGCYLTQTHRMLWKRYAGKQQHGTSMKPFLLALLT